ncbi:TPA: putative holin-like toxin [Enterococcus faecalis]|nr:putative holin-like toxin [Enterococcus faecalis]NSN29676.1 putative holin-like toxin [Enterococcus faecalis]HBI1963674.1 putative holin-like toxin [Enterococcus faecalis]
MRMNVLFNLEERKSFLTTAEALALMISFGSLIASLIFGILGTVKSEKK